MTRSFRNVAELFRNSGRFEFIFEANDFIYVANCFNDLTAFCAPSIRRKFDFVRVEYDIGFTILERADKSDQLRENLVSMQHLSLPRTLPTKNSLDTALTSNGLSDWLVDDMLNLMNRYCLSYEDACILINSGQNRIINGMRSVYGERFDRLISEPLARMQSRGGNSGGSIPI